MGDRRRTDSQVYFGGPGLADERNKLFHGRAPDNRIVDDHDLAVLVARLGDDPTLAEGLDLKPILDAVGTKRHQLQARSVDLGRDIYEDPSTDFLEYVERIWGDRDSF